MNDSQKPPNAIVSHLDDDGAAVAAGEFCVMEYWMLYVFLFRLFGGFLCQY